jgi:GT2 family glycosyltransferase
MSQPAVDISIIIATLNARHALERNLGAIYRTPTRHSIEVFVVDDGSTDGSAEMVAASFPQVHLIVNGHNIGYAYSCNRAIERAQGRFIHLLNNDVELLPETLDTLADFLTANPSVGAAGSLLLNEDGSVQQSAKALPTLRSALFGGRSWLTKFMPNNRFTRQELQHWRAEAGVPFTTGYVSGASMMVPRDVLDKIGELDERLFYFNDADFCKRIWDVGYDVCCVPAAKSIHLNHQGGSRRSLQRRLWALMIFHRGALLYSRKHAGYPAWHPHQLFVAACLGARLVAAAGLQLGRELTGVDRRMYGG